MYAHPGITPTQDEADGRVRINLDAVAEWQAVKAAYLGGNKDPFNVVTSLYHEMVEHSEGARIDYDHFESRGPRDRSLGFPGPSMHERGEAKLAGDAKERAANREAIQILRNFTIAVGAPVRPTPEYVERRRSEGVDLPRWIPEPARSSEYPRDN